MNSNIAIECVKFTKSEKIVKRIFALLDIWSNCHPKVVLVWKEGYGGVTVC